MLETLFALPPLRLQLPDDVYGNVPACWWSAGRWVAHNLALYDTYYVSLRRQDLVDSVGRRTFEAYLQLEAGGADFATGRNSRVTVVALQRGTLRSESTIHRCRRLTHKLGTRTVVFRGRQRTKAERLYSWRRADTARGWAAVSALHESVVLPVDNCLVETLLEQGFGTPPGRSPGLSFPSCKNVVSSSQNTMKRCAPRSQDKQRRAKRDHAYDPKARLLASGVRRDERFPLWVRLIRPGRLSAVVTRKALAGWDTDDVYGALEEWRIAGKVLLTAPRNPAGYLWTILDAIDDDVPPARLDRARTVASEEAEQAHRARQREEARQAAIAAAGPDSPGRKAAMATARATGARNDERARKRARDQDEAIRELARRAREQD